MLSLSFDIPELWNMGLEDGGLHASCRHNSAPILSFLRFDG